MDYTETVSLEFRKTAVKDGAMVQNKQNELILKGLSVAKAAVFDLTLPLHRRQSSAGVRDYRSLPSLQYGR